MIRIRCVHIKPVLDHQQLGALDGAASAGAVQRGLPQAVQGGHLGSSLDQGCCTPGTELLLVFILIQIITCKVFKMFSAMGFIGVVLLLLV